MAGLFVVAGCCDEGAYVGRDEFFGVGAGGAEVEEFEFVCCCVV